MESRMCLVAAAIPATRLEILLISLAQMFATSPSLPFLLALFGEGDTLPSHTQLAGAGQAAGGMW